MKLRPFDFIAFAVAAFALAYVFIYASDSGGDVARVRIEAESGEWVYPLETGTTVRIPGPLGTTTVVIGDGQAGVVDSPCREKVCIASSPIFRTGTWVACLPNRVFVRIEGAPSDEIDAGTY